MTGIIIFLLAAAHQIEKTKMAIKLSWDLSNFVDAYIKYIV